MDGDVTSESDRVKEAENKRQLGKSRVNDNSTRSVQTNLVCPICHRLFHARIGLFSHICAPINLRYSFTVTMVIIILMDEQRDIQ